MYNNSTPPNNPLSRHGPLLSDERELTGTRGLNNTETFCASANSEWLPLVQESGSPAALAPPLSQHSCLKLERKPGLFQSRGCSLDQSLELELEAGTVIGCSWVGVCPAGPGSGHVHRARLQTRKDAQ